LRRRLFTTELAALLAAASARSQPRASTASPRVQVLGERLAMPGLNRERTLRLYVPPSYATSPQRRYPVLYLHDAQNLFDDATAFAGEWGVDETLDALAAATGFEAIVVGIDHGGARRTTELNPWAHERFGPGEGELYLDFIVRTVKPFIDARWRTRTEPAATLVGGSSLGGLVSHAAIHRHPDVFGRALVFSPAYWIAPAMAEFAERRPLPKSARVYFYAGGRESRDMLPLTEKMHALLQRQGGAATVLRIAPDAQHNEAAWRAAFEPALRWLFELG